MKKLLSFILISFIALSCVEDESIKPIDKESIYGFWTYKNVTYNGQDISKLTPGFTVSNYLNLHEDFTYGKCYILGTWSLEENNLYLSSQSGNEAGRTFTVLSITENTLQLAIRTSPQEYGIRLKQFDENKVISIVETFERYTE